MFYSNQYVYRTVDGMRYVYRIVSVQDTTYTVQVPYFSVWGTIFARWSRPKQITKKYLESNCTVLDSTLSNLYDNIKKGDPTKTLFV